MADLVFTGATQCEKIIFGETLEEIGKSSLTECDELTEIYIYRTADVLKILFDDEFTAEQNFNDTKKLAVIYVPDELVQAYKVSEYWKPVADKIKPLSSAPTK